MSEDINAGGLPPLEGAMGETSSAVPFEPGVDPAAGTGQPFSEGPSPDEPTQLSSADAGPLAGFEVPEALSGRWDESFAGRMVGTMEKIGITPQQACGIVEAYEADQAREAQALDSALDSSRMAAESELRREWGSDFESRVHAAGHLVEEALGSKAGELLNLRLENGARLGDSAPLIRVLAAAADRLSIAGSTFVPSGASGGLGATAAPTPQLGPSPIAARDEQSRLMADPEFVKAYTSKAHPRHSWAVRTVESLTRQQHGSL
jgi:hypothetical protein